MRVLHVDAFAGASGDMILGALLDIGVPLSTIRRALQRLPVRGWSLSSRRVRRAGIAARKVTVRLSGRARPRGWKQIRRIVERAGLDPPVRDRVLSVFRRLVEAEASVHGVAPEAVHLHEVGAVDAIVDVVGACVGFAHLAVERIVVSPLTTGYGEVRCEHGLYPVPAPATAWLTRGVPVRPGDVALESLTPTGAAVLTTVADAWGPPPAMRPEATGYGAGDRDTGERANLLRLTLGEARPPTLAGTGEILVVELDVDDAPAQNLAHAAERWIEAGALDVQLSPVQMKKGRPGHRVTVLGRPQDVERLAEIAFRETTTLGVRYRVDSRIELPREHVPVRTAYGRVRVKVGRLGERAVQAWPEYEDCLAVARRRGVALKEVQQAAMESYRTARRPAATRGARRRST